MKRVESSGIPVLSCILLMMLLWMMGCAAKMRPPLDLISTAETAILKAREADAGHYAPLDLRHAEEKISRAREELATENYGKSHQLAQDALLDAQLAEATSSAAKATELLKKMEEDIHALKREIESMP